MQLRQEHGRASRRRTNIPLYAVDGLQHRRVVAEWLKSVADESGAVGVEKVTIRRVVRNRTREMSKRG